MTVPYAFGLALIGCVVAAPLSLAQTAPSGPTTTYQTPTKQSADGGAPPNGGSGQYPNDAHKQATQGLPPGLSTNGSVPWNNRNSSGGH